MEYRDGVATPLLADNVGTSYGRVIRHVPVTYDIDDGLGWALESDFDDDHKVDWGKVLSTSHDNDIGGDLLRIAEGTINVALASAESTSPMTVLIAALAAAEGASMIESGVSGLYAWMFEDTKFKKGISAVFPGVQSVYKLTTVKHEESSIRVTSSGVNSISLDGKHSIGPDGYFLPTNDSTLESKVTNIDEPSQLISGNLAAKAVVTEVYKCTLGNMPGGSCLQDVMYVNMGTVTSHVPTGCTAIYVNGQLYASYDESWTLYTTAVANSNIIVTLDEF
jgi:hypothetical protein